MTVMSVDDSATMRKIISTSLKGAGHEVLEAENGKDALTKLSGNAIELFLVDVNMPVMNGIDFVAELRKIPGHAQTPVIILTTETEQEMVTKGKAVGANAWIIKPFESDELLNLIRQLTGK